MICEVLRSGKQNARSTEDLVRCFNFTDKRELQKYIAMERKAGAIILSTCENGGGYFLSGDRQEIAKFCKTLENRAIHTLQVLESAKKKLADIDAGLNVIDYE